MLNPIDDIRTGARLEMRHRRIQAQRLRNQLGIAVRRQTDAALEHFAAQTLAVHQLPVVRHRHRTLHGVHDKRLTVDHLRAAGRRVARVADAEAAAQLAYGVIGEHVTDHADAFVRVECARCGALGCGDAGHLLAAMLQRHQTQADDLGDVDFLRGGPITAGDYAKDAAFVCEAGLVGALVRRFVVSAMW